MNTAKQIAFRKTKIVRLNPKHNPAKHYANTALTAAQSTLWNKTAFSKKELAHLSELMAEHFDNGQHPRKTFLEIIQRICLAKRYLSREKGRYIAKPVDWLNIFYYNGLSGTAAWLEDVKSQRKTCPEYNKGIKIFAEAVLNLIEKPQSPSLEKYRSLLIKNRQFDLLQAYANILLNLQIQK